MFVEGVKVQRLCVVEWMAEFRGTKVKWRRQEKNKNEMVPGQGGKMSARAREFSGAVRRPIQQLLFFFLRQGA